MENYRSGRQRQSSRSSCITKLSYVLVSGGIHEDGGTAELKDLSPDGACILTRREIRVPALLRINIPIPGTTRSMLLLGKAIRCVQKAGKYEIGLKLVGTLPTEFGEMLATVCPPAPTP